MSVPRTQSLTRAVALLKALRHHPRGATTAALARATGLPPATAGRLLITLADEGFVRRAPQGWVVGAELVTLARRSDPDSALARRAQPLLAELAEHGRESAMLAVPAPGPAVDIIAQVDGPWLLGLTNWVGRGVDLHASAAGKLLLAELGDAALDAWIARARLRRHTPRTITTRAGLLAEVRRVRARGWADLRDESEPGLWSVAVPVRDADGALAALLGFSGPTARVEPERLLELLLAAATRLS